MIPNQIAQMKINAIITLVLRTLSIKFVYISCFLGSEYEGSLFAEYLLANDTWGMFVVRNRVL